MRIFSFTLGPDAVSKLYDALLCLGKFSETVSIEPSRENLLLTALNSSKSAYASFAFPADRFFTKYSFNSLGNAGSLRDKFTCKIYIKALLAIFKGRAADPNRERETGIEYCEVYVEDGHETVKSRFVIRMVCRHGVLKTYRLTFEAAASMRAVFDSRQAINKWSIASRTLREFVEHFGPKTEQLDIFLEDNRANFTSYTEKIMSGNEVLKQPLRTSIAIDTSKFGEFSVEEKLHIIISVKDFKTIVTHASSSDTTINVSYSRPTRPLRLGYDDNGVTSEFILSTRGEHRGSTEPTLSGLNTSSRATSRRPESFVRTQTADSMLPPPKQAAPSLSREPSKLRVPRPSPPPPQPSLDPNALFVPEDDDRQWDPVNFDEEDEDGMLGWDPSANATSMSTGRTFQDNVASRVGTAPTWSDDTQRLSPTQRLSQIHGLFDD